ncbi:bifunctional DNA primase/polymerase [Halorhabdus sp. CUG00001]|uniref:bifunctional DNA primase/polymerase n=1 Tax=Halorhabdus sp. CUG00001 TaxID=2600297 RepID=UPI00131EB2CB|nr:bifunctional DNA primase/polymerase [Halorhabdus sp. CUG00001]
MDTKTMTRTNHNTDSDPRNLSSQDSTAHSSGKGLATQTGPRSALSNRIAGGELDVERFVPLQDGTKKSRVDHTDPAHQYPADELAGNYGVMAGDGLVIVDIDDYDGNQPVPDSVTSLPPTFTVETPHGGEHRYYAVSDAVSNSWRGWGEIRAENQYVVGPGSDLDSCSKDWHDCSADDAGRYAVLDDRPLAHISQSALPQRPAQQSRSPAAVSTGSSQVACLDDVNASFGKLATRLRAFLGDDRRKALWEGRYSDARHNDRSQAEAELAHHLGWFFEGNIEVVKQLMTLACEQFPTTDWNEPRKWLVREDDSYRVSTCELPDYNDTYTPPWSGRGPRSEVSQVTSDKVLTATFELYPAKVDEIANHEEVDVCREQTRKALEELRDYEILAREKDTMQPGKPYVYYPIFEEELNNT